MATVYNHSDNIVINVVINGYSTTIVTTRQHDSITKTPDTIYMNIGAYTVHNLIWKNGFANKQSNITFTQFQNKGCFSCLKTIFFIILVEPSDVLLRGQR